MAITSIIATDGFDVKHKHRRILRITPAALLGLLNPPGDRIISSAGWPKDARITGVIYRPYPDENVFDVGIETEEGFNDDYGFSYGEIFTPSYSVWNSCPGCSRRFADTLDALTDQA